MKILNSRRVFGFTLYKRVRIEETTLVFNSKKVHCDDIGLFIVGKYPKLEYNFVSVFPKKEWKVIAFDTINLAILNLALTGTISIHSYKDEQSFLGGFKYKSRGYYFKIEDIFTDEDLLTKAILNAINEVDKKDLTVINLRDVIPKFLNTFLDANNTYGRPEKQFIIELLKRYSRNNKWLTIEHKEKLLGIYRDYAIKIEPIYIPRIHMQHQELLDAYKSEAKYNRSYQLFRNKFREELNWDFKRRHPKTV
ncbi:hypothetical protein [Psychroserpens sp. MEBiC05023]